jgi:hypothetical protein
MNTPKESVFDILDSSDNESTDSPSDESTIANITFQEIFETDTNVIKVNVRITHENITLYSFKYL